MLRNIKYAISFVWRVDKAGMLIYLLLIATTQVFNSAFPLLLKFLIDSVMEQRGLGYMLGVVLGFTAAALVTNGTIAFMQPVNTRLSHRVEILFSDILSRKSAEIDMASYDDPEFYNNLRLAFQMGQSSAINTFQTSVSAVGNLIGFAASMAITLALEPIFLILSVASAVVTFFVGRRQNTAALQYSEESVLHMRRADYFKEAIYKRDTAEDFKQYDGLIGILTSGFAEALKKRQAIERRFQFQLLKMSIVSTANSIIFSYALPYGYLAVSAFAGRISVGDMSALITSYNMVRANLSSIAAIITSLKQSSMYAQHLRTLLEYEPKIEKSGGVILDTVENVEFRNVHFRYPAGDAPVLDGVSFEIKRGEKAALVGVNGAGKTTIARLLLRFYDPQEGSILINGRDIREYDVASLRRQVATVFQDFQRYPLTITELVACTDITNADEARVRACLEKVGLLDIIDALPEGIRTEYGKVFDENGIVLSGGQLQKLVIARMLYKGSSMVIMDEPSSALDPESEYMLNRDIARAAEDKTVLLISHRLSTTRDADKVILIENGVVGEQGSHSELMRRDSRYARLFRLQASGYIQDE